MYLIDHNTLKSQIRFTRQHYDNVPVEQLKEDVEFYTRTAINVMTEMLNIRDNDFAFTLDTVIKDYPKDIEHILFGLGEIIIPMVFEIRKEFCKGGHDPRLKYKLVERRLPMGSQFIIMMDLEFTFLDFKPREYQEDVANVVEANPDQELMNALFAADSDPSR